MNLKTYIGIDLIYYNLPITIFDSIALHQK